MISFDDPVPDAVSSINACMLAVVDWISVNSLKLTTDKTEVLVISGQNSLLFYWRTSGPSN